MDDEDADLWANLASLGPGAIADLKRVLESRGPTATLCCAHSSPVLSSRTWPRWSRWRTAMR